MSVGMNWNSECRKLGVTRSHAVKNLSANLL